ncbi:MAG: hypothetical protein CL625_03760 [Arenimonas sp.]|nr:hypothetical protein [Arenimonas sp.]
MSDALTRRHLDDDALAVIASTAADRIAWFQGQSRWIPYESATDVITRVESLVMRPRHHRMRGMLVVAESNNGKSRLAAEIAHRFPFDPNEDGDHSILPVMLFEMPPRPDEVSIVDALMKQVGQPFRRTDPIGDRRDQLVRALRNLEVKVVMGDDLQKLLGARQEQRRVVMDAIRYLCNQVPVPFVGFSTKRGAAALSSSDEMINRMPMVSLPTWALDDAFRQLLAAFQRQLPLREPSRLTTRSMASLIHVLSEGLIGEVHDLLESAVERALTTGRESIDEALLRELSWIPPSQRKRLVGLPMGKA